MRKIFQSRALLVIGASQAVSGIGNWISLVAVFTLIVFYNKGGVTQTSWVLLAGLAPTILCSPLAGWCCDRFDRKWLMILSEFCSGLAVLGIVLSRRVEFIYGLIVIQSCFGALLIPASQSALPSLVREEDLTRANAFLQQLTSIIKIGGPLFAGALLAVLRPQQAMILDVISFGLSVLILSLLPALPPMKKTQHVEETPENNVMAPATGTVFNVLRASSLLRLLFVVGFFLVVIVGNFDLLAIVFIRDVLRQSASFFGLLVGIVGFGMAASSGWLLLRKGKANHWRDFVIGCLLLVLLPGSIWLTSVVAMPGLGVIMVIIGCLFGGLGIALVNVQEGTLLQLLSPRDVLGRLSGLFQSILAVGNILVLLVTPLFVPAYVSTGPFMGIGALAMLFLTVCTILTLYSTRRDTAVQSEASHLKIHIIEELQQGE
jgi:MFS family permease